MEQNTCKQRWIYDKAKLNYIYKTLGMHLHYMKKHLKCSLFHYNFFLIILLNRFQSI